MSNYTSIDVYVRAEDADVPALLPATTIHVYDYTNNVALADLTTDANGHIPAGTLAVAVGTKIRFWFALSDGRCGFDYQVTT